MILQFYTNMASANVDNSNSLFYQCIQGMLKSWTALQLAVSQSFAGPHSKEKAQWLVGVIETFFNENADLEPYEVEEFIEEIMSNEFNIITEDDSIKQISIELCNLYLLWSKKKYVEMKEHIAKLPCVNLGDCLSMEASNASDDVEKDSNLESLNFDDKKLQDNNNDLTNIKSLRSPDEDGWMSVIHKKKH